MQWFRWYNDTHRDPKIRALPVEGRWLWATLLDLCSMADKGGIVQLAPGVPYPEDILADEARIPMKMVRPIIEQMKTLGLIREDRDGLFIVNWDKRQYRGDNSTERSRLHRQRKRNADATLQQQPRSAPATPPDTDTDSDKEEEAMREADDLRELPDHLRDNWMKAFEFWYLDAPPPRYIDQFARFIKEGGMTDRLIVAVIEKGRQLKKRNVCAWASPILSELVSYEVRTVEEWHRFERERNGTTPVHSPGARAPEPAEDEVTRALLEELRRQNADPRIQ